MSMLTAFALFPVLLCRGRVRGLRPSSRRAVGTGEVYVDRETARYDEELSMNGESQNAVMER